MDWDEDFLAHYGKKGMKWGQRKAGREHSSTTSTHVRTDRDQPITVTQRGSKGLSTSGGKYGAASPDARNAAAAKQAVRKSGVHSLSNKELQELVTRMNLEQQYSKLSNSSQKKSGQGLIATLLKDGPKIAKTLQELANEK